MAVLSDTNGSRALMAPPPLGRAGRWRALPTAAVIALAAVAAMVVADGIEHGRLPFPGCGFKAMTGLACPGCGGTRALAALAALDLRSALALNPGAALAALLALAGAPWALLDGRLNSGRGAARMGRWSRGRGLTRMVVAVLALNWIFLVLAGR